MTKVTFMSSFHTAVLFAAGCLLLLPAKGFSLQTKSQNSWYSSSETADRSRSPADDTCASGSDGNIAEHGFSRRSMIRGVLPALFASAIVSNPSDAIDVAQASRSLTLSKWAVVTGASSGIGKEIAVELGRRGYSVILAARSESALRDTAAEAREAGASEAVIVACDLGKTSGRRVLIRATRGRQLSMAVLNAGFASHGPFIKQDRTNVESMIDLNVGSTAVLAREFAEAMAGTGGGTLMLTGSISGAAAGVPNAALYGATKSFVRTFAAGIRAELAPMRVSVTCLLPGATDTNFASAASLESSAIFSFPGVRRLGAVMQPRDVAFAAVGAAEAGRGEVVPGLLNKVYVLACGLSPAFISRAVAGFAFGDL